MPRNSAYPLMYGIGSPVARRATNASKRAAILARDLLVGFGFVTQHVDHQVVGLDALATLLPMVDRVGRLQRLDRAGQESPGFHGEASYPVTVATLPAMTPSDDTPTKKSAAKAAKARKPRTKKAASDGEVRLTADRLIVRTPGSAERKSASGLLIPATAVPAPKLLTWGDVTMVGPDVRVATRGDRVLFLPSSGLEVELDGEDLVLLRERDIQAVTTAATKTDRAPGQYL